MSGGGGQTDNVPKSGRGIKENSIWPPPDSLHVACRGGAPSAPVGRAAPLDSGRSPPTLVARAWNLEAWCLTRFDNNFTKD